MIFQNPRTPESFLSLFEPLRKITGVRMPEPKALLNAIMVELGRFERQDIVEASLHLERAHMLASMLGGNVRQKMNATDREIAVRLLKKTWSKISLTPIKPDDHAWDRAGSTASHDQGFTDLRVLMQDIVALRALLNHFGDLIQNNATFGRMFRDSRISFATQTLEESIQKLRVLEDRIKIGGDDAAYEKAIPKASETIEYLELTPDLKWFRILDNHCNFEGEMMGHCASEGGDRVNLFSLRERRGKYFYPVITAAWHPLHGGSGAEIAEGDNKGYLTQIKGTKNTKPLAKWHGAIVALLMDDEVGFLKKSSYKPELDFSINDLEPEIRAKLLKAKPGLESWKKFVEGIAIKSLVGLAKDNVGTSERERAIKIIDKDTVELFRAEDPQEFWVDNVGDLVTKHMLEDIKRIFDWLDSPWDVDFRDDEVPVTDLLEWLKSDQPRLYAALEDRVDSFHESEKFSDLEEFLRSDREEAEEIFSAFQDAYRSGLESGFASEAYNNAMNAFDGYQFYNGNGTSSVICERDESKTYLWRAVISKQDLATNLLEYEEQSYSSDFLDWLFASNGDDGQLIPRNRRSGSYFRIADVSGEYDEGQARERLIETLHEAGVRESKKEKNPKPKLSSGDIKKLEEMTEKGDPVSMIAHYFNVSTNTIKAYIIKYNLKYPTHRKLISETDKASIIEMGKRAISAQIIAEKTNVTVHSVYRILDTAGVPRPKDKPLSSDQIKIILDDVKNGVAVVDVAKKNNVHFATVYNLLRQNKLGKKIDREAIVELFNKNYSQSQIAEKLNIHPSTVLRILQKLGLPTEKKMSKDEYEQNLKLVHPYFNDGLTMREIQELTNLSKSFLQKAKITLGFRERTNVTETRKQEVLSAYRNLLITVDEVCKIYKVSNSTLPTWVEEYSLPTRRSTITEEALKFREKIKPYLEDTKYSYAEIGEIFSIRRTSVYQLALAMDMAHLRNRLAYEV